MNENEVNERINVVVDLGSVSKDFDVAIKKIDDLSDALINLDKSNRRTNVNYEKLYNEQANALNNVKKAYEDYKKAQNDFNRNNAANEMLKWHNVMEATGQDLKQIEKFAKEVIEIQKRTRIEAKGGSPYEFISTETIKKQFLLNDQLKDALKERKKILDELDNFNAESSKIKLESLKDNVLDIGEKSDKKKYIEEFKSYVKLLGRTEKELRMELGNSFVDTYNNLSKFKIYEPIDKIVKLSDELELVNDRITHIKSQIGAVNLPSNDKRNSSTKAFKEELDKIYQYLSQISDVVVQINSKKFDLNTDSLSEFEQKLFTISSNITELKEKLSTFNDIGKITGLSQEINELSDSMKSIRDSFDGFSNNQENIKADLEQITSSLSDEGQQLVSLQKKFKDIESAIRSKTDAIIDEKAAMSDIADTQEKIAVEATVRKGISDLDSFISKIEEVKSSLKKLSAKIDIDVKFPESIDDAKLKEFSDTIKNIKIDKSFIKNLNGVVSCLSQFQEKLNEIEKNDNNFLKEINEFLSKGEELKNLASILNSTKKNLDQTKKSLLSEDNKFQKQATTAFDNFVGRLKVSDLDGYERASDKINELNESIANIDSQEKLAGFREEISKLKSEIKEFSEITSRGKLLHYDDIDEARASMENLGYKILSLNKDTGEFTAQIKKINGEIETVKVTAGKTGDEIRGAFRTTSVKELATEVNGLQWAFNGLKNTVTDFIHIHFDLNDIFGYVRDGFNQIKDIDNALSEMRKVSEDPFTSLKNFQRESYDIANEIGVTGLQLQQSTADFMRIGDDLDGAVKHAKDANILFQVSEFDNIEDATSALVSMSQAWKDVDTEHINNVLNILGNEFPIASDELAQSLQRSAGTLATFGATLEEASAITVASNSILQDPLSVAAGLRTIELRMVGTKEAKDELIKVGEDVDDFVVQTQSKLRESILNLTKVASNSYKGFDILDENGNYKSFYERMQGLSDIYAEIQEQDKKLGTNSANAILELIAGKNRSAIAGSILKNPDVLRNAYETALNSEGSAMAELEKKLDTIDAKTNQLQTRMQEFWSVVLDTDDLKAIIQSLSNFVNLVTEIIDKIGLFKATGLTIGAVFGTKNVGRENDISIPSSVCRQHSFGNLWQNKLCSMPDVRYMSVNKMALIRA